MGRSKMISLKITLLPLAICLLLSLNSQVSPKYFLIETKEKAKKSSDYVNDINNSGLVGKVVDESTNVDYGNPCALGFPFNNARVLKIKDNFKDYMNIGTANNAAGGSIVENNNNHYWG